MIFRFYPKIWSPEYAQRNTTMSNTIFYIFFVLNPAEKLDQEKSQFIDVTSNPSIFNGDRIFFLKPQTNNISQNYLKLILLYLKDQFITCSIKINNIRKKREYLRHYLFQFMKFYSSSNLENDK